MQLTREQILARKKGAETYDVELKSGTVTVRAMTRKEAAGLRKLDQDDVIALEAYAIATCLITPALSFEDVLAWLENEDTAEIQKVVSAIEHGAGHGEGQAKGYTKSVPRGRS